MFLHRDYSYSSFLLDFKKRFNFCSIGETIHTLQDAERIRIKILKAAENVDMLSNKIGVLGQNSENPPSGNQLLLQKAIHNAATYFLKEKIVSLPSLPKEEQIKEAQERRRYNKKYIYIYIENN